MLSPSIYALRIACSQCRCRSNIRIHELEVELWDCNDRRASAEAHLTAQLRQREPREAQERELQAALQKTTLANQQLQDRVAELSRQLSSWCVAALVARSNQVVGAAEALATG